MSGQSSNDDIYIFIVRHGEAEPIVTDDRSRQLSAVGQQQALHTAQWLKQSYIQNAQIDKMLVSPYVRARQTHEQIATELNADSTEYTADIIPEGIPSIVHDYIDSLIATEKAKQHDLHSIMLVSHMPFVSYLVDELCHEASAALFATGSVAVVRYSKQKMRGELVTHYQGKM